MKTAQTVGATVNIAQKAQQTYKPLVSIVAPAFNEAQIIEKNLTKLCEYMETLEDDYRWEVIVVNDGSTDETGDLADAFAETRHNVHVLHHMYNFRMGQALRYAFSKCKGDYVVVIDMDLSYSPDHIGKLLSKIRKTRAKIVIASPYMKGGRVSNVPWVRKMFSICANRFLSLTIIKDNLTDKLTTITGMVRAYDCKFLSRMNLKAMDVDIQPEIIHKAMILHARIVEIPAHLDWGSHKATSKQRKSSIRIVKSIMSSLLSGFIFRPFMFFILPGLAVLMLSLYTLAWALIHTINHFNAIPASAGFFEMRLGYAIAAAFKVSPQSFLIGGISLMVAIQLISLGLLALQSKRYFEELFHLSSTIYRNNKEDNEREQTMSVHCNTY